MLEIIYQDEYLVAINKPHGLLVHRTNIAEETEDFALQKLSDQLNRFVYPCHRIDRKTAGVLLFALDRETEGAMKKQFADKKVDKFYHCMVRGFFPEHVILDKPLAKENGKLQDAQTSFFNLVSLELPIAVSRYPTSRYSMVLAAPKTGRMHQIRRHLAHLRHYIVGDRTHGECKQNNMFRDKFGLQTMMLHAWKLVFTHPVTNQQIEITADWQPEFADMVLKLNLEKRNVFTKAENVRKMIVK